MLRPCRRALRWSRVKSFLRRYSAVSSARRSSSSTRRMRVHGAIIAVGAAGGEIKPRVVKGAGSVPGLCRAALFVMRRVLAAWAATVEHAKHPAARR